MAVPADVAPREERTVSEVKALEPVKNKKREKARDKAVKPGKDKAVKQPEDQDG